MNQSIIFIMQLMVMFPLFGALLAGLLGKKLGKVWTHRLVISFIFASFLLSCALFYIIVIQKHPPLEVLFYTWATAGLFHFDVAFLIDSLSAVMSMVVLFISLMVHIYTIGYMAEDEGYQRFFSYVSLFTFSMLVLVLANNFFLLFFGWEGVGLVSYLLIGFWFKRETAVFGSLKAFIVNRVGDIGFLLAIACVLMYFNTVTYHGVFQQVPFVLNQTISIFPKVSFSVIPVICFLLFIGAMAKSAQIPLHVWLPESMEGPTPISALIHAATMVTAGIYMVARMSPLFEYAPSVLSFILVIGGTTTLLMGLVAFIQHDIKRVIAYSTISQLGVMTVALGASAYDAAIFHLITHAFFKALLFLAAGSVIVALHHEQDMRKMGGLAFYMPVTYLTFVVGALALSAIPPFAGFYSKDTIIEAVQLSTVPGARYAYLCVLTSAFVTPLYIFRALFMTFHTQERLDPALKGQVRESPWVILVPLVLLAIPSLLAGQLLINPLLYTQPTWLANAIFVLPEHQVLNRLSVEYHGVHSMALRAGKTLSFWLAISGILTAWAWVTFGKFAAWVKRRFSLLYVILLRKYGFDDFNQVVFVRGARETGHLLYDVSDIKMIDGVCVNGSGRFIRWFAKNARLLQTGYLYHYALCMILGVIAFLSWYIGGF